MKNTFLSKVSVCGKLGSLKIVTSRKSTKVFDMSIKTYNKIPLWHRLTLIHILLVKMSVQNLLVI